MCVVVAVILFPEEHVYITHFTGISFFFFQAFLPFDFIAIE